MNMNTLKETLRPWMQVDTWESRNSYDDKRFHKALQNVFLELGASIDGSQFEDAILELVNEYYPDWNKENTEKIVHEFALRAEQIANYVSDTIPN